MILFQFIYLAVAQAPEPVKTPSPEVIKALTDLLKALGSHPVKETEFFSSERLTAIATLISSVAWPLVAAVILLAFKPQLEQLSARVTEFKIFGVEGKIEREIKNAAEDAIGLAGKSGAPTDDELARARKVENLISSTEVDFIRKQAYDLAAKYERIRASEPPGDLRTGAMEGIVSQMRSIGRAVSRFRYELTTSASPGRRLQAIASLQVLPDFELLGWLAQRVSEEKPFVAYHALVALMVAVKNANAHTYLESFQRVVHTLQDVGPLPEETDRRKQIDQLKIEVSRLEAEAHTET